MTARAWAGRVRRGALLAVGLVFGLTVGITIGSPADAASRPVAAGPLGIDYRVARQADGDGDRYLLTLRFAGDHSGRTSLHVPRLWPAPRTLLGASRRSRS